MNLPVPPPLAVLRGHTDGVNALQFLTTDALVSASSDGQLKLWSLATRRASTSIEAHPLSIQSISLLKTRAQIVTSGREGCVKLWDCDSSLEEPLSALFSGCNHFCNSATDKAHEDVNSIATGSGEISEIKVWDTRTPVTPAIVIGSRGAAESANHGMVTSLLLHSRLTVNTSDGGGGSDSACGSDSTTSEVNGLLAGYEDGAICLYDLRCCGAPLATIKPHAQPVFALNICPAGHTVVSGAADRLVQRSAVGAVDSNFAFNSVDQTEIPADGTSSIHYRDDGRLVVSAHWDSTVRVFESKRLKPLAVLRHHRQGVNAVAFAPKSAIFATSSKDCTIAVWSLYGDSYR